MSTFNAEIYIGNRGNTILSFDLYLGTGTTQNYNCSPDSGVTFNTFIHSGTTRVYQNVQWNDMYSGQTLFVDNIPMGTTHVKVVANRLSGVCNNLQPQIICIQNRPTPTPTPSSTPTSTPTPTPSPTTSPTPTATSTPTPTPTPTPTSTSITSTSTPTPTPTPTPTGTPIEVTITVKYHGTLEPIGNLACNTGTDIQVVMDSANFCTAETYVSSYFTSIGTGTFWISYNGKYRQIFHSSGNSAIQSGTCKDCVGVEPTYYYYALGDCNDLKYSGVENTKMPFGPQLFVPVCMTDAQISAWYQTYDPGTQNLIIDYSNPCGFGNTYVPPAFGRSSISITEGTIYSIGDNCWSVIEIESTQSEFIDLDEISSFDGTCFDCIYGAFTEFTYSGYSITICGTGVETVGYVNNLSVPLVTTGAIYPVVQYDENGTLLGSFCATWGSLIGAYNGPLIDSIFPGITAPPGIVMNGDSVADCNSCVLYYRLDTNRCDGGFDTPIVYGSPIWTTDENVSVGDVITTNLNDNLCRIVTSKTTYKMIPFLGYGQTTPTYMNGYFTGVNACADCISAGGSGGGVGDTGNVSSITGTSQANQSTYTECGFPNTGTYYNEYSENVTVTFLDINGTPVTPNGTVEYSMDGGVNYTTVSVTSNTYTFPYTFTWRDVSVCSTADRIVGKIRINNIIKFSWTAGLGID